MKQPPKEVEVNFVINYYKDMDYADEIEFSNSYSTYAEALEDYEEAIKEANNKYFVELTLETEIDGEWEQVSLAHNYYKEIN